MRVDWKLQSRHSSQSPRLQTSDSKPRGLPWSGVAWATALLSADHSAMIIIVIIIIMATGTEASACVKRCIFFFCFALQTVPRRDSGYPHFIGRETKALKD